MREGRHTSVWDIEEWATVTKAGHPINRQDWVAGWVAVWMLGWLGSKDTLCSSGRSSTLTIRMRAKSTLIIHTSVKIK